MKEIRLYKSRSKALKLILGSAAFVAIGFFMYEDKQILAIVCIVFFGLALFAGLFQFFDRRPQIIINEIGIFDRTTLEEFINWEIIHDAYIMTVSSQPFICLIIDENYSPSKNKSKFYKSIKKLSDQLGFQELNISLGSVDIKPYKLLEFVIAMINAERPAKANLIMQGI